MFIFFSFRKKKTSRDMDEDIEKVIPLLINPHIIINKVTGLVKGLRILDVVHFMHTLHTDILLVSSEKNMLSSLYLT